MRIVSVRTGARRVRRSSPEARYLGHWGNRTFPQGPVLLRCVFPRSPVLRFSVFASSTGGRLDPCDTQARSERRFLRADVWLLGSTNAVFLLKPVQRVKILDSCPDDCGSIRVESPAL